MTSVKVTTVGNSLGIVLPREVLARLRVDKGDLLYLVETTEGIELVPYNPEFVAQIETLERTARAERDVLRGLTRTEAAAALPPAADREAIGQAANAMASGEVTE
ncbi:MAG: AbrB/MazE/SpoVT family DNA-binding domain-containing protein [Burkholderiales bacterium]|nr:MAG: AbrB/MazE/SpoVT family DNA-binding domain-containing protein [Burkholderiales bacterium]